VGGKAALPSEFRLPCAVRHLLKGQLEQEEVNATHPNPNRRLGTLEASSPTRHRSGEDASRADYCSDRSSISFLSNLRVSTIGIAIGAFWGLIEGFAHFGIFAWLYNVLLGTAKIPKAG
jgi:hypothetical protein